MKARLIVMLFISLAVHGWLLWAAPASEVKAPSGTMALKLGQLHLAASRAAKATEGVEQPGPTPAAEAEPVVQPPAEPAMRAVLESKLQKTLQTKKVPNEAVVGREPSIENKAAQVASAPQNTQQSVSEESVLVERPAFASPPTAPSYPDLARQRRQQGTVVVEVQLDRNGAQLIRTLLQSSGVDSLDEAALKAVSNWEFLPYRENGRAHLSRVRLPIRFSL